MAVLRIELNRAFKNKLFLGAVLIQVAIVIYHIISYVIPSYYEDIPFYLKMYELSPLKVDGLPGVFSMWLGMNVNAAKQVFFVILPLVSAIPYGASLYLDERNHYVNNIGIRTNKRNYYVAKFTCLFLSGGVVAVIPLVLSFLANLCILPIEIPFSSTASYFVGVRNVFGDLFYEYPVGYLAIYILWVFLIAGILTTFCFTATYIMENRFIILMAPFILYFASYVGNNMIEGKVTVPWNYIQFNKLMQADVPVMLLQVVIFMIINVIALCVKSSSKKDVL